MSLSVKNFLIRKLSSDMIIPEATVEAVVNHQFAEVVAATEKLGSLEISGFGKLLFNRKKAELRMVKYMNTKQLYERQLQEELTPPRRRAIESRMGTLMVSIEALKSMLHEDS